MVSSQPVCACVPVALSARCLACLLHSATEARGEVRSALSAQVALVLLGLPEALRGLVLGLGRLAAALALDSDCGPEPMQELPTALQAAAGALVRRCTRADRELH